MIIVTYQNQSPLFLALHSFVTIRFGSVVVVGAMLILIALVASFEECQEKALPLERGFYCMSGGVMKFRLQFFVIMVVFILFDLEVVMLAPIIIVKVTALPALAILLVFIGVTL